MGSADAAPGKGRQLETAREALSALGPTRQKEGPAEPDKGCGGEGRQIEGDRAGHRRREDGARRQGHGARLCSSDSVRNRNHLWI